MSECFSCLVRGREGHLEHLFDDVYQCDNCGQKWECWGGDTYLYGWGVWKGRITDWGARWLWDAQQEWVRSLCYRASATSRDKGRVASQRKTVHHETLEGADIQRGSSIDRFFR